MQKPTLAVGTTLMLVATTMLATAYHIPMTAGTPFPGDADDWIVGDGQLVLCEDPEQGLPGIGGLCWASSQHLKNVTKIKDKKDTAQDEWGAIEPKCRGQIVEGLPVLGDCPAVKNETGVGQNWFARIGSNTRACDGAWDQTFVYKEMIAYYGGTLPDEHGVSGHVTFFVNDLNTFGTYNYNKFFDDPDDPDDPETPIDEAKSGPNCTGNDIGLCDGSLKDAEPCGGATKVEPHVKEA